MKKAKGIGVGLRKEDGFIEIIFGEDSYAIHPAAAVELAKAIAVCLREGEAKRTAA